MKERRGEIFARKLRVKRPKFTKVVKVWDWRLKDAENNKVVATSGGQGFTERNDAREAFEREFPGVEFEYVDLKESKG